jgi:hypothetical protein
MPIFQVKRALIPGVSNPIVARLTLQALEILSKTTASKEDRDKVGGIFTDSLVKKLLRCWEIEERIRKEWGSSIASFKPPEPGTAAIEVPQISRLREDCEEFLYSAKNFLRDLVTVYSALHGCSFKDASEWTPAGKRTDSVLTHAQGKYGVDHVNAKYFAQLRTCIMPFVEMRNAVEHPGGWSGTLTTNNIEWAGGHELTAPTWWREKAGATAYGPEPIIDDMRIAIHNLLILAEDVLVMWAVDHLEAPGFTVIAAIPEAKRDPNCAIKYKVVPGPALLEAIASAQTSGQPSPGAESTIDLRGCNDNGYNG